MEYTTRLANLAMTMMAIGYNYDTLSAQSRYPGISYDILWHHIKIR